ncbi:MAG: DNA translocase FtsK, partial [Bacilli bacterium]
QSKSELAIEDMKEAELPEEHVHSDMNEQMEQSEAELAIEAMEEESPEEHLHSDMRAQMGQPEAESQQEDTVEAIEQQLQDDHYDQQPQVKDSLVDQLNVHSPAYSKQRDEDQSVPLLGESQFVSSGDSRLDEQQSQHASLQTKEDVVVKERLDAKMESAEHVEWNPPRMRPPLNVMMLAKDRMMLERKKSEPQLPPIALLKSASQPITRDDAWIEEQTEILNRTLETFHVRAKVSRVTEGPTVTRFELAPELGVKVSKITALADDLKLHLSARDLRIEAPIPGMNAVGIEIPNRKPRPVVFKQLVSDPEFIGHSSKLTFALGMDLTGQTVITDIEKMPHGLIAGSTGSGKSVCINSLLMSVMYKATPEEVRFMLIDPKMVELMPYNDMPHLVCPVITDVKTATQALKWAVDEMESRYERFVAAGVRNLASYYAWAKKHPEQADDPMPRLVIIIDELADLMMQAASDVEECIARLAQKARAAGIHLIVATQRPSVNVITGLIKANIPTRISFAVVSQIDSRTVLDSMGAEQLLGRGDMLFLENGKNKPVRLQGCYVTDEEIDDTVSWVKERWPTNYLIHTEDLQVVHDSDAEIDGIFFDACRFAIEQGGISTSSLQRKFRIGFNRASRIIEMMEERNYISEQRGSKLREVHITEKDIVDSM